MPRAAVCTELGRPVEVMDLRLDPPRAGEVAVRLAAAGVCASDLSVLKGDLPGPRPIVLVDALKVAVRRANTELNDAEQIRRFAIVGETWLPGGDELTPTMKLKRRPIAAKHAALIEALYGNEESHAVHQP